MKKVCIKCKEEKAIDLFCKDSSRKGGHSNRCKACVREHDQLNKERKKQSNSDWRAKNPEYFKQRYDVVKSSEYNKKHRQKRLDYKRERRKVDPLYKLSESIRSLIGISIKGNGFTKRSKTFSVLGCEYIFFKDYIESKFKPGMSWENHGEWHYDHIIPVSSAKNEEEIIKLNHYTNFQPLWALENIKKSNKH